MTRLCTGCEKPVSRNNTTGYCIKCLANLPEERENRRRYASERWYNPQYYQRVTAKLSAAAKRRSADPIKGAALREIGRQRAKHLHQPEIFARSQTPEARAKAGQKITEHHLGWCPLEYRDQYKLLTGKTKFKAAEARQIILEMVARDKAKAEASLSPFERQDLAMGRGATLYETAPRATLDRPGVYRS